MRIAILAALVACSSPSPRPAPVPTPPVAIDPALAQRVDAAIDKALAEEQIVGLAVLIAREGKIVYARYAGLADRESKQPMREDTIFRLASMTKPLTSVAALALVDRGKLALEDPVTKYLPDFKPRLADGSEATITVRHLITHTSGLTYRFLEPADSPYHKAEISDGIAEPGLPAETNLRRLASVPLKTKPGTAWQYSLSVDVLGEVVARAGGSSLPEVIAELITRPLAMTDTSFTVTDRARLATPYAGGKPPIRMTEPYELAMGPELRVPIAPNRIFDPKSFPSGGAGAAGTARDYLRFAEALRTGTLLKPDTARAATSNQLGELDSGFLGPGLGFGYGFGVHFDPVAAKTQRGRGSYGWAGIYGTEFWIDPEAKLSVVILTNVAAVPFSLEPAIYAKN